MVYQNKIWWIDQEYNGGSIGYLDINQRDQNVVQKQNLGDRTTLKDLKIYSPDLQTQFGSNPCWNQSLCSQLCLYNGDSARCECSLKKLADDGRSCVDYSAILIYSGIHFKVLPKQKFCNK